MTVQQRKFKVLLVGDACWDIYVYVDNTRKNPESDVPLLKEKLRQASGGMALNVLKCLENLNIDVTYVVPTTASKKTRFIDSITKQQYFRLDNDIKPDYHIPLYDLNNYDAIVISDYNKGFISDETIKYYNKVFNGSVFLDTKKNNLQDFKGCFIKINNEEAANASNIPASTVITEGRLGAILLDYRDNNKYPALRGIKCVDVCGAGDAFLAGYVLGYLKHGNIQEAVPYGIVNSGISVTKYGTYAPTLQELEEGLIQYAKQCW